MKFEVLMDEDLFNLMKSLNDVAYSKKLPFITANGIYMKLVHFHMMVAVLKHRGYTELEEFDTEWFQSISLHKKKLYFGFTMLQEYKIITLDSMIYDETADRMGLIIKKSLLKHTLAHGMKVLFDQTSSKQWKKSIFRFR
jgi:hypothetical protein